MNPAWCRQYATSFVPVRGGFFNPNRFECAALSCTAYPCCLFHSATHPFWPSSRLDCHITEIFPEPLRCGLYVLSNLDPPTVQFSANIVILCGVRREPPTSAGRDPATGGTDQTRTGGLLIPNQARYQLRYGSILAADGGVEPHGFHRALFSRQAPRPLEFICRIGWRFCTMHDQESNLTVWGLEPRCTSKDDRHPILRGIGVRHRAMGTSAGPSPSSSFCYWHSNLKLPFEDFDNCAE